MIGSLDLATLQKLWWILASVVGSLFLFLTFVQGGQTLIWQLGRTEREKSLIINSIGRKWELTFTTLVLFGGALFAAFPKFYATSFGGAYWVWIAILFTFIVQAVSFEYRKKPNNLFGPTVYEAFLFINGAIGILLIGTAVGTFFTGANFVLDEYNFVKWTTPFRGLEAAQNIFNVSLGLFLVMNARVLGALYLLNNIDFTNMEDFKERTRNAVFTNFIAALPFLLIVLIGLLTMDGFGVNPNTGVVSIVPFKYLKNLVEMPIVLVILLAGLALVIFAVYSAKFLKRESGIWFAGLGTVLVGLAVFFTAGFNNTPFYPSRADLQSSLTIFNASSSHYTLTAMTYVALIIPVVLAYIAYVWKQMDSQKLRPEELEGPEAQENY
ncbi:MAG: cytochrome d ubiquinol oxidase subunit II [Thermodesulfobacteria bacterium]|nr:cytochrome d ubiquinol oxidase subunit II [Thermodesulfobacteriota bacterium]